MPKIVDGATGVEQEVENGIVTCDYLGFHFDLQPNTIYMVSNGVRINPVEGCFHVIKSKYIVYGTPKPLPPTPKPVVKDTPELQTLQAIYPDLEQAFLAKVLSLNSNDLSRAADSILAHNLELENFNDAAIKAKMEEMGFSVLGLTREEMIQKLKS